MNSFANADDVCSRPMTGSARRQSYRQQQPRLPSLHAGLAQEAHDTATLVAATGSIVNAVVSGRRPQLAGSMATYLPLAPALFPAALSANTAGTALPNAAVQSLSSFYNLVAFARAATVHFSRRGGEGNTAGPIGLDTLGEAWQAAATQAIGALTQVGFLEPSSVLGNEGARLRLFEMLWGVIIGRSPCVRVDGAVIVPGWAEHRANIRRKINTPGSLEHSGAVQQVVIRDISAGGLGIEGCAGVPLGAEVSVSLECGLHFKGTVVWSTAGRLGVKLSARDFSPVRQD